MKYIIFSSISALLLSAYFFTDSHQSEPVAIDPEYQKYWYNNEAEISSYQLQEARYGEIHEGQAALIFVTEHFSKKSNTKADNPNDKDIPVMKLNFTKKFYTGVYPYSMMTSTFFPFTNGKHSLKISSSSQEWCGHTFMEMKEERNSFDIRIDSYFEGESKEEVSLGKALLEDDLWTMIRLNPDALPTGTLSVIPAFFTLRLLHLEAKAYEATGVLKKEDQRNIYTLRYPKLERTLTIYFEPQFPYKILGWEDEHFSGWGAKRKQLKSTATLIKAIKSDYWTKNSVQDSVLRQQLMLK
jgi:hypothetical protein